MRKILTEHAWAFRFLGTSDVLKIALWENWREGWQTAWRYYYIEDDNN